MVIKNQAMGNQNASKDTSSVEDISSLNVGGFNSASKPQPLKGTTRRCPRRQAKLQPGSHLTTIKQGRLIKKPFDQDYKLLRVIGKGGFAFVCSTEE
ncbi:hypothetical protein BOTNAR_0130g00250 [Botryotinia narcissicola]|uniref:Uncharacterized protein n=1 Tax=Botryotinia narcissicola TaxID=278944 RepID=A0A4Z1IPJ7_9HELO|nr:hypothetical protein BOTNAR_0130g00250 [Botryotinia narcissicola]